MGEIADMHTDYFDECDLSEEESLRSASCKVCKKRGLEWEMTPAGWRLFEGTQLHSCIDPFKLTKELEERVTLEPAKHT